jgi:chorismate dehydratase
VGLAVTPAPFRVGRIPFLVCAPYFHASLAGFPGVTFVDGPPRALNSLLADGVVDCAPSSSFEYARNASQYLLLPGLCTSGRGEVKSVLLFSREPWESLAGKPVELSPDSDTSNTLVRVISRFHFGVEPVFQEQGAAGSRDSVDAKIAIGDAALRESTQGLWPYRYDLAQVWQSWQGTPLPLGLWILRASTWEENPEIVKAYYRHLKNSLTEFFADPAKSLRTWEKAYGLPLPLNQALDFFSTADYQLTPGHERSLRIFFDLCTRANLLPQDAELRFAGMEGA